MKDKTRRLELRTADGKVILVLYLSEEVVFEDQPKAKEGPKPDAGRSKPQTGSPSSENPPMTDAQKRYLFRILAERGIEGDKAYEHLKKLFQVDTLKEITKIEASRAIESLLSEGKGGTDGTPF